MNRNSIIGIISLIGIALMAFAVGRSDKTGESVNNLFYIGMILGLAGSFSNFIKDKKDETNSGSKKQTEQTLVQKAIIDLKSKIGTNCCVYVKRNKLMLFCKSTNQVNTAKDLQYLKLIDKLHLDGISRKTIR